jgi:hypothetical protein
VKKLGIVSVYLYSESVIVVLGSIIERTLRCPHSLSLSLKRQIHRHIYRETHRESDNVDIVESFLKERMIFVCC